MTETLKTGMKTVIFKYCDEIGGVEDTAKHIHKQRGKIL